MSEEKQHGADADPLEKYLQGSGESLLSRTEVVTEEPDEEEEKTEETVEDEETVEEEEKQEEKDEKPFDLNSLTAEQQLQVFNNLTSMSLENVEAVSKIKEVYDNYDEFKKNAELYPKVVEQLKKKQNVLDLFPDEETYKVVQLAKEDKYKGKQQFLMTAMKSDVDKMSDMDAIALGASIEKSTRINNPLRSAIKALGIDPDDAIDDYEALDDDDKDVIADLADTYRTKLTALRNSVEAPTGELDIFTEIEQQEQAAKDDYAKQAQKLNPISTTILNEITEIEVDDDFSFVLDLTAEAKKGYADFLTKTILNGTYDLATDEGKGQIIEALKDKIWEGNRKTILKAYGNFLREKTVEDSRQEYNNEKPLNRNERTNPKEKGKTSMTSQLINDMISERL